MDTRKPDHKQGQQTGKDKEGMKMKDHANQQSQDSQRKDNASHGGKSNK